MSQMLKLAIPVDIHSRPVHDIAALYSVADIDDASDPKYYGMVSTDGAWLIQKYDEAAGTIRWCKGDEDYTDNWSNRAALSYDLLFNVL